MSDHYTPTPTLNWDGTVTGVVDRPLKQFKHFALLPLRLPTIFQQGGWAGRYFLARCGAQTAEERLHNWQIYLRRPLYVGHYRKHWQTDAIMEHQNQFADSKVPQRGGSELRQTETDDNYAYDNYDLILPFASEPAAGNPWSLGTDADDAGYRWLAKRQPGEVINVLGLFGNGFILQPDSRNLLLVADARRTVHLYPLVESMLDRGGRVTFICQELDLDIPETHRHQPISEGDENVSLQQELISLLPFAVETRIAASQQEMVGHLEETLQWADQLCAALPASWYLPLADMIRRKRFRLEPTFAQILVEAEMACGVGACLACIVPLASGRFTRACIHGPVLDLVELARL